MSDLEKARAAVERQKKDAETRTSKAQKLAIWYRDQGERNGWRTAVERLVRGEE